MQILNLVTSPSENIEIIHKLEEIDMNEEAVCSICLDNIGRGISLPTCKHFFHKECITKWMEQASTCPYCRAII
jgi:E3 ubiquitin-protein ligase ATL41